MSESLAGEKPRRGGGDLGRSYLDLGGGESNLLGGGERREYGEGLRSRRGGLLLRLGLYGDLDRLLSGGDLNRSSRLGEYLLGGDLALSEYLPRLLDRRR